MHRARKIFTRFNGFYYPQEYLCMPAATPVLNLYLLIEGKLIADITSLHCFTGYHPLVMALPGSINELLQEAPDIEILFTPHVFNGNVDSLKKDAPAMLGLQKFSTIIKNGTAIIFYQGTRGRHRFTSQLQQYIGDWENRFFARKPGNVFLEGNLLKQVQIAYAIPRNISVATVGNAEACNFFPTDLHGSINDDHYIVSLRHEGRACAQVLAERQMVVAEVNATAYRKVYALGKNHMKSLQPVTAFDAMDQSSANLGVPLHQDTVVYRELELEDSLVCGIHRLLLFRIIQVQEIHPGVPTLQHIHNCSATWQRKQGREGNYLMR